MSLPQLKYLLDKNEECQDLKAEVESRIREWPYGRILRPSEADPLVEELNWFDQGKCSKLIERARYASLLWNMRNFAVHEFISVPGKGTAISPDSSTPYYHGYTVSQSHSWELYIPSEVLSRLVLSCSDNLKRDFKQKERNPYDSFEFGSSWFPDVRVK